MAVSSNNYSNPATWQNLDPTMQGYQIGVTLANGTFVPFNGAGSEYTTSTTTVNGQLTESSEGSSGSFTDGFSQISVSDQTDDIYGSNGQVEEVDQTISVDIKNKHGTEEKISITEKTINGVKTEITKVTLIGQSPPSPIEPITMPHAPITPITFPPGENDVFSQIFDLMLELEGSSSDEDPKNHLPLSDVLCV